MWCVSCVLLVLVFGRGGVVCCVGVVCVSACVNKANKVSTKSAFEDV